MPTFEHTIDVAAPVERVSEFMTDPTNWPRTHASISKLEITESSDDETRMDATFRVLGVGNEGEMVQRILEPDSHVMVSFESPGLSGKADYRYSESDGVTTIVEFVDYEFGDSLLDRIMEPVAKRYNERQFRHSLESSRELIEAEFAESERMAAA
ncbi:MAG: SRPBCC family protein [Natronomonas sp.]